MQSLMETLLRMYVFFINYAYEIFHYNVHHVHEQMQGTPVIANRGNAIISPSIFHNHKRRYGDIT
jgi:hypothetical protein